MARILVTEEIAEGGLDRLRAAGHEVEVRLDLTPEEVLTALVGTNALIIRSATNVSDEVLAAGRDLVVVGRAGIGLDNVDVDAATRRGVMVVNAPESNIVSAAEHTMALLLAQARNVPQAHSALVAGRWERSKWEGVELADKTLGIIGFGRIGKLVADRARAFGLRLIAFDPFVSADRAHQLGVELLPLDQVVTESDFLTIHLPRTPETTGLIGRNLLVKAKPTLRIINVARGGIVDEAALADAVRDGVIAGAALDVFDAEPTTESPLFGLESVVVTPHLGASTREAQDKAGDTIADMVQLALAGDFVPFAVNLAVAEVHDNLRPFLPLAERLGRLFGSLVDELPSTVEIAVEGDIGAYDTRIVGLSVLKGLFGGISDEPVTYVNAATAGPGARDRGARGELDELGRLRQPGHGVWRRSHRRRHAGRPARRAPDRPDRRAHVRRSAGRPHADGRQRRPAGCDRCRRDHPRQRRGQHRRHGCGARRGHRFGRHADRTHQRRAARSGAGAADGSRDPQRGDADGMTARMASLMASAVARAASAKSSPREA